jgi:LacI family transcriptional regulator
MADVARAANVSTATVSHVLNGTRTVSDETAARVRAAIESVGYRLDPIARALRTSRTNSVGVVVSDTGHPIFADMIHGIDEVAARSGLSMLLTHSDEDPGREKASIDLLVERRIDGLLIVPSTNSDDAAIEAAAAAGLPVVAIDRPVDAEVDHVAADAAPALRALILHLVVDHGHTDVAVVVGTMSNRANTERLQACIDELQQLGCELLARNIIVADEDVHRRPSILATRRAVRDVLERSGRPTALVSLNAEMTVAAVQAAGDLGVRIPDDVALVALDDLPWAELVQPEITCAAQPAADIGREAMNLLLQRIDDRERPIQHRGLACTIRRRRSCGCEPNVAGSEPSPHDAISELIEQDNHRKDFP